MKVNIGKYSKDPKKERKVNVRIDPWDTWNMDSTLALIITPMLHQLKEQKNGGPFVADEDVPEELRTTAAPPVGQWETDENWFKRWDYVLGEMLFAFENYGKDWEDQFWITDPKIDFSEHPEDEGQVMKPLRWAEKGECDWEGRDAYARRMQRGLELFGKYYQNLWT